MKKELWLSAILTIALLGSCDNDDKYPIEMSFDEITAVSSMRIFTQEGLLDSQTNQKVITDYLDRYYSINQTSYNSKFHEPDDSYGASSTFTFYEDGKVSYAVQITDTYKEDDATIMKSVVQNKVEDMPVVKSDLFKYKFSLNDNGTYNYQYVTHYNNKSLVLSLLYYKLVRYKEGKLASIDFGTVHNEFNENFISTLGVQDTLAVKQYALKYSVK